LISIEHTLYTGLNIYDILNQYYSVNSISKTFYMLDLGNHDTC